MSDIIYLDNAATTALDARALDTMLPFLGPSFGNPSSIHRKGREAKAALEEARAHIAALFDAAPAEIIVTSGGTEADNLALHAALTAAEQQGRRHIVTSKTEHEAVLKSCEWYAAHGWEVTFLDVLTDGTVSIDAVAGALRDDTALVALMHANNETGALNPIEEIAALAHERRVLFHTDTVQSAGKLPISSKNISFDFAATSAHKIHGPKGIGALFARAGNTITPMLRGGSQERGRRGGTENTAAIVGFGEAARLALAEREDRLHRWQSLGALFRAQMEELFPDAVINTGERAVPNIISISFPFDIYGLDGEALLMNMDLEGVALSSGSACTAGSIEPSRVMLAAGHDEATAKATLRFSFGKDTAEDELTRALEILSSVITRMRSSG